MSARKPGPLEVEDDGPDICPAHGLPFCNECVEDVADESLLTRTVIGPHHITGDTVVRWLCRECLAAARVRLAQKEGDRG